MAFRLLSLKSGLASAGLPFYWVPEINTPSKRRSAVCTSHKRNDFGALASVERRSWGRRLSAGAIIAQDSQTRVSLYSQFSPRTNPTHEFSEVR